MITLPGPDKGVDDFLVAQGALAYERLSHEARCLRDWQYHDRQSQKTAYQPPRKLTPEEAQHKLTSSSNSSPNSPIKETHHDNHQQPQQSTTRTNSSVNSEARPIVEQSGTTFHQNRPVGNSQSTVESNNSINRTSPDNQLERVEIQSNSIPEAIHRITEQPSIEQSQTDSRGIDPSLTSSEFPGQRTTYRARSTQQFNPTSLNSTTSDVHINGEWPTRNSDESQLAARELINAIANFLETSAIESAIDVDELKTIVNNLLLHQHQQPSQLVQETFSAVANFLEEEEISTALLSVIPSVTQEITQYQQHLASQNQILTNLQQSLTEKSITIEAIKAIADYLDEREIESSTLVESVRSVIELLNSQPQRLIAPELIQQASSAIAHFMEEEEISIALLDVVPSVTQEITQYRQNLVSQNQVITTLQHSLEEQLVIAEAIKAIADYLDEREVESSALVHSVRSVIGLLNSQPQTVIAPELLQQASSAIASFMKEEEISTALLKVVPSLTNKITEYQKQLVSQNQILQAFRDVQSHNPEPDSLSKESQKYREQIELLSYQDFYNLAMYVKSYFEEHSETKDNPRTKALLIIRQIFREMKAEALKNQQQSPKFKL